MSTLFKLARSTHLRALAFLSLSIIFMHPIHAMEVKAFAIGDFVPSSLGGCGGSDRTIWPLMVDAWYDHMAVHGHTKDGQYTDGNMTIQRFCDPDSIAGCLEHLYLDEADAAMIATHGADSGDHWQGTMRYSYAGNCALDAGGSGVDMNVGDVDLEFLHLSSCNSADDDNLNPAGNLGVREALTDPVDGGYAHLWTGFHGVMYIGNKYINDYSDFAHDAHSVGIAYSWVTNHYRPDSVDCDWYDPFGWFGTCQDICPVAVSQGETNTRAWNGIQYERYNNVYSDPTGNGYWYWMGYLGCDSVNETGFNP